MVVFSNKTRIRRLEPTEPIFFHTFDTRLITSLLNFPEKRKAKTTPNIHFTEFFLIYVSYYKIASKLS